MNSTNILRDKINKNNWVEIKTHNKSKLKTDQIYCRYIDTQYKTNKLMISIGNDVCNVLEWKVGDRVSVFTNKIKANQFMIKKSNEQGGLKLGCPMGARALSFGIQVKDNLSIDKNVTSPVFFELDENCVVIDISQLK